jgi:hypothetical protein
LTRSDLSDAEELKEERERIREDRDREEDEYVFYLNQKKKTWMGKVKKIAI